jgi:hypothetical protein
MNRTAKLKDGRTVEYVETDSPPSGTMKRTYFSPDRSYVVQFYHDQSAATDPNRLARLEAVLGKYNPTTSPETGAYWQDLYCWPTGIVVNPMIGVVCPAYPRNFFFDEHPIASERGQAAPEKKGRWFSSPKLRALLKPADRGDLLSFFKIGIRMARAVRRLHQAGLAHSDLSSNNVLVDPTTGKIVVIDIDSLVVPGVFPPDVIGTKGYIAPEVLATHHLPHTDPNRRQPNTATDQHALAVLLYEYLLYRHPLNGPKIHAPGDSDRDEVLALGERALYVEHPTDPSNRPPALPVTADDLGQTLKALFEQAFVTGLHQPNARPTAMNWERGLIKTFDLLHPCPNDKCPQKWFVVHSKKAPVCPYCRTRVRNPIPRLTLFRRAPSGGRQADGTIMVHRHSSLNLWHVLDNQFPGETADRLPCGFFEEQKGQWFLVNHRLGTLSATTGGVPIGGRVPLTEGAELRLSADPHGRTVRVEYVR